MKNKMLALCAASLLLTVLPSCSRWRLWSSCCKEEKESCCKKRRPCCGKNRNMERREMMEEEMDEEMMDMDYSK
jgi:hypothetical protein